MKQRRNGLNSEALALREKWLKEIKEMTLLDRVKNINTKGENVREVFEHNFRNYAFLNYYKYFENMHPVSLRKSINDNFDNGMEVYSDDSTLITGIYAFLTDERIEIEQDYAKELMDIENKRIQIYYAF
ncbi:MAG: hypothetical protein ACSHXF_16380 [Aquaticitalea sp.]